MRLLPEDEAVKDYLWLAKVSAARTTSELEAIIEEIVKKPNTSKDEDAGENAGDGAGESAEGDDDEEAEVSNKALTRAWERLGYPRELAALRAELSYTEDQSELEWLAEKIRNYHIKKEKRAEVFKLVGDVRKKQGNTRLAFENYKKAMECAGPSYVKTELDRIFMKDFYYGGRKASLYAKRGDAVEFLDNWLGKYGSIEEIKALFDKIV